MAGLTREDLAQIETFRATATPDETARFAAELYKLRNTPGSGMFAGFPVWLAVCIAVWLGLLETADKLPQLLLSYPRYEAALAEVQAKIMQPDLLAAQLTKARNEAEASQLQPQLTELQLRKLGLDTSAAAYAPDLAKAQKDKAVNDVKTSALQPDLTQAQLDRARNDAKTSALQPDLTQAQLDRARNDARTSGLQPELTQAQLDKARNDALASNVQPDVAALQLQKSKFDTLAAAFQPKTAELQATKLGIETKLAGIQLPLQEQGTAIGGAALNMMTPFIMELLGIKAPAQSQQPAAPPAPATTDAPAVVTHPPINEAALTARPVPRPAVRDNPAWNSSDIYTFIVGGNNDLRRGDCQAALNSVNYIKSKIGNAEMNYGTDEQLRRIHLFVELVTGTAKCLQQR
jgi:hypothetical protein